ncbi:MAG TPA: Hsp20/alpha crystallin family protein [Euzebyales bacterium]
MPADRTQSRTPPRRRTFPSRRELRQGSFSRTLALPAGVTEDDITASYEQGILEILVPMPQPPQPEGRKIAVPTK